MDDFKACGKERNYEDFQFRYSILSLIADHLPEEQGVAYAKKLRDECRVTARSIEQRGRAFECMFSYNCTVVRKCDNQTDPTNLLHSTNQPELIIDPDLTNPANSTNQPDSTNPADSTTEEVQNV